MNSFFPSIALNSRQKIKLSFHSGFLKMLRFWRKNTKLHKIEPKITNFTELSKIDRNDIHLEKAKWTKNGQKWSKMAKNGQKWPKMVKKMTKKWPKYGPNNGQK